MKTRLIILLLPFIFIGNTCKNDDENCHERVIFINETNKTLYVKKNDGILLSKYAGYPYSDSYKTLPNEKNRYSLLNLSSGRSYCFENTLKDTLRIFIFEEDVLANHTWDEVVDNYLVLRRYDLSLSDLQELNWQISYSPTELMKDMQMYPPYKEE